ncbi:MAG: hypothetical protein NVS2B16_22380 [Chloroflexota bacterium]
MAESLAILHAHYWGADRLRAHGTAVPGRVEINRYLEHNLPGIEPMIATAAGEIDTSCPELIRRIAAVHPQLMLERTRDAQGFTLVHGDPNPGNILALRSGAGRIYLIDRRPFDWSLTAWLGVADIAYAMVHWWDKPLRRRFEVPVLRRYHDVLQAHGVTGYSWDHLIPTSGRCVVEKERTALRWVWLPQLRKFMAALVDLQCAELWNA